MFYPKRFIETSAGVWPRATETINQLTESCGTCADFTMYRVAQ